MFFFFFQAEDGIRDLVRSRGLGDVYKRQQLLVIKLANTENDEQTLRIRIPNQSVTDKTLPAIGETVTLALKVADSYLVS